MRKIVNEARFKEIVAGATQYNGQPKVLFRWGFKLVDFNGEKLVEALTKEEYIAMRERDEGHPVDIDVDGPHCYTSSIYSCLTYGGCTSCEYVEPTTGAGYCVCTSK